MDRHAYHWREFGHSGRVGHEFDGNSGIRQFCLAQAATLVEAASAPAGAPTAAVPPYTGSDRHAPASGATD